MKKMLCLLVVLALVMAIVPTALADATEVTDATALESAFTNGGDIKLGAAITLDGATLTIPAGVTVTLDLNGYTISGTSTVQGHAMIKNNGTLIVNDTVGTGKISYTFTGTADSNFGKGNYTVVNSGTMTVNGGTIENTSTVSSHMLDAIDNNSTSGNAILTINGGTVICPQYMAIRQFANSTTHENKVIVNDGTITGGQRAIWMHLPGSNANQAMKASLEVSGGTLTSNDEAYNLAVYLYSYGNSAADTQVKISGGTFNGDVAINGTSSTTLTAGNLAVTDGTFNGKYGVYGYGDIATDFISGGTFQGSAYDDASSYLTADAIAAKVTHANGNTVYAIGAANIQEAAKSGSATVTITQNGNANNTLTLPAGTTIENNSGAPVKVNGTELKDTENMTVPAPSALSAPVEQPVYPWFITYTEPTVVTVNAGESINLNAFAVYASAYQWQVLTENGWHNIDNGAVANFVSAPVTYADNGAQLRCIAINQYGYAVSQVITLNVLPAVDMEIELPQTGDASMTLIGVVVAFAAVCVTAALRRKVK